MLLIRSNSVWIRLLLGLAFSWAGTGASAKAFAQIEQETKTPAEKSVAGPSRHMLVVIGAAGEAEFGKQFDVWAERWRQAAQESGTRHTRIGGRQPGSGESQEPAKAKSDVPDKEAKNATAKSTTDRDQIKQWLKSLPDRKPVWIILIGHGTFDGRNSAKFNLKGPDVSATEFANWLKPIPNQVILINCASASGPFINRVSGPNRVVITSTKSGFQYNFSRFGDHISTAISSRDIDLDKDGQTSLLEAFLAASNETQEFYKSESRLATEHALLDDNGDGLGTQADWFTGIRATREAKQGTIPDGPRANQIFLMPADDRFELSGALKTRRDQLELEIEILRARKKTTLENDYYRELETILLEIARTYEKGESGSSKESRPPK